MARSYLPDTDDGLLSFALNFSTLLSANYTQYFVPESIAQAYAARFNSYRTKLEAAQAPETRGRATVLAKNIAKKDLVDNTRQIARMINNDMRINDNQRQALGLTIRKTHPTPVPAPSVRPGVDLVGVSVRTVTVHIHDSASSSKRGKPEGVLGAKVYTYVGPDYPSDPALWAYEGDVTRSTHEITFPDSVAAGAQVWICAAWYNRRGETGPVSMPITTNIQGGGMAQQQEMKLAA